MVAENATPSVTLKRWPVAAAGVAMQMLLGTVYAWSVFKKPLMEAHGWSVSQTGNAFILVILFIGVSAAFGGKFVDRAGSRRVASLGAVLFALGTLCAGLADRFGSLWLLWIGYGVIGGIGNGLCYITPIAVLVRWFPDRRGMITGLAVMGFGLGSAVMAQVAPLLLPTLGIASTFYLSAAVFLVGLLIAAQAMNNPPAAWQAPAPSARPGAACSAPQVELRGALGMFQFYVLWALMFINVTAGLTLISNLSPLGQKQLGLTPLLAGTVVSIAGLANGFGRIFWAALSDRIGRKATFATLVAGQIPLLLLLPHVGNLAVFTLVCSYILLCYGGGFGSMPAFAADTFGSRCLGEIYGKILLAWGVAGIVGPKIMDLSQKVTGGYAVGLQIAAGLLLLGLLLALSYRRPVVTTEPEGSPQASGAG